jgi:hypothetical protein
VRHTPGELISLKIASKVAMAETFFGKNITFPLNPLSACPKSRCNLVSMSNTTVTSLLGGVPLFDLFTQVCSWSACPCCMHACARSFGSTSAGTSCPAVSAASTVCSFCMTTAVMCFVLQMGVKFGLGANQLLTFDVTKLNKVGSKGEAGC